MLVSDRGGGFKANHGKAIAAALGIVHRQIDAGQAWQSYIETHFNVMRRMADYHYARATSWGEAQAAHGRFFQDYNQQAHFAHRERADDRLNRAAVVGWAQRSWCDPLADERAAETLAQRRVAVEADRRGPREVADPRFFPTGHSSPQRLAPYRPRSPGISRRRSLSWSTRRPAVRERHA